MYLVQAIIRSAMVHSLSRAFPLYIVNEFPKSGGTWVGHMLSSALSVPFPRNCIPKLESSIMHGHYLNSFGMTNVLCVWRDGRDVMVSWYYHCLFENEHSNRALVEVVRNDLKFDDYKNIKSNLPCFIDYVFREQKHPNFSWANFVYKWYGRDDVVHVHYEDLRVNTANELRRVVKELSGKEISIDKAEEITTTFSFARMAGRQYGEEKQNSFMRKGIVGDWKNHFTKDARKKFATYAGEILIEMGYESNNNWVTKH